MLQPESSASHDRFNVASRLLATLDWAGLTDELQDSLRLLSQLQCLAAEPGEAYFSVVGRDLMHSLGTVSIYLVMKCLLPDTCRI